MEKVIYSKFIPFKGYKAMAFWPFVLVRREYKQFVDGVTLNHESIHLEQQKEMVVLLFYVWYMVEWLIKLIIYHNQKEAYRNISFEQEAYKFQIDTLYIYRRKKFGWVKYITKKAYRRIDKQ